MFDFLQAGRWIILAGISLIIIGGLIYLTGKLGGISQIPGTLRFEGQNITCIIPLLASIVLSIVLTVLLNILARWIK
jgi:hypothetical protein